MGQSSLVFVNTRNILPSDQTTQNSVNVTLDEPIFVPEDHECLLSVNQAQIPNSFYSFTEPLTFNVRWNGLAKTMSSAAVGTNWITFDTKTQLFVGQVVNVQSGIGFGGIQPSTSYVISEIDPTGNRIRFRDFIVQPTIVSSVSGANMAVVSVNHFNQEITLHSGANINVGDRIRLVTGWGTALPTNVNYYVVAKPSTNVIKISDRDLLASAIPVALPIINATWSSPGDGNTYFGGVGTVVVASGEISIIGASGALGTLVVNSLIAFSLPFCGILETTSYSVRSVSNGVITLRDRNTPANLQPLVAASPLPQGTIVEQTTPTGTLTTRSATTQSFTIDTSTAAPTSAMPAGAYTLASFGATAAATNALVGKTLAFTNGITSTLTLSSSTVDRATSQLTTKPLLVPKINMTFTASSGTLADFVIENFTSYTLGFENQNILGAGTLAIAHPMLAPRYILVGSSLRVPGQIPGGRIKFNPIATIPMQATFGSVQAYVPPFPTEQRIDDEVIRSFTLQMYDELGNLVNFNGVEWQVVLEFKMQPKRKPVYKYSM